MVISNKHSFESRCSLFLHKTYAIKTGIFKLLVRTRLQNKLIKTNYLLFYDISGFRTPETAPRLTSRWHYITGLSLAAMHANCKLAC